MTTLLDQARRLLAVAQSGLHYTRSEFERERYEEIAQLVTGNAHALAEDGIEWVHELCNALHVPPLGSYGITEADYAALIEKAAVASSMQGNPIKLTADEMHEILVQAQ